MSSNSHTIASITPNSPADNGQIQVGDILLKINNEELTDIFDYHYLSDDENISLELKKESGEIKTVQIQKDLGQDLGLLFENGLLDDYKSCSNKCVFCFIDQMPPGMRETLYFKDDDTRLSFLQGNYVTLTNMKQKDLDRIVHYHLAPINISVHTTNPTLRCEMLHNRFAGDILDKINYLYENEIEMNSQIVLCKGLNDGQELERTIKELLEFMPYMQSLSVVPVGLTKYREGLYPLETFDKESAKEVLSIIRKWQEIAFDKYGAHFVQASDEWYLLAEEELPTEDIYDGYIQLENGVGMLRLQYEEFNDALLKARKPLFAKDKTVSIVTGKLAYNSIKELADLYMKKFPKTKVNVYPITNYFFGEQITVSGLITAKDLLEQLANKDLGDKLLIPCNMLRMGEEVFLDDVTLDEVRKTLQVKIDIVKSSGQDLLDLIHNK